MIRGTNHEQDARFTDKTKKMLQKSQWPDKYDIKIDLSKVDQELINIWIEKKVNKMLGQQDDIVSGTIISLIDQSRQKQQKLIAKQLHVAISGLLQQKTLIFMSELWDILDEAQKSLRGIPQCLIQEKKKSQQIHKKKLEVLNYKRGKLNDGKITQVIKRLTYNRPDENNRQQQYQNYKLHLSKRQKWNNDDSQRERHSKKKHKKVQKQKRDRSRSRNHNKKKHRKRSQSEESYDRKRNKYHSQKYSEQKYRRDDRERSKSGERSKKVKQNQKPIQKQDKYTTNKIRIQSQSSSEVVSSSDSEEQ